MSPEETISEIVQLLKNCSENELSEACLSCIQNADVVINSTSGDSTKLHKIYLRRFGLQENVTKSQVVGYESLLPSLESIEGLVTIFNIVTKDHSFVVFSSSKKHLLGILKSPHNNLEKLFELQKEWDRKSIPHHGSLFNKKRLIKSW